MGSVYQESGVYSGFTYCRHRILGSYALSYSGDRATISYSMAVDQYYGYLWGMGMSVEIHDENGNCVHHSGNHYGVLTWNPGASWERVIGAIEGSYTFTRPTDATSVGSKKYSIHVYEWGSNVSGYGPARNNISTSANITIQPRTLSMPSASAIGLTADKSTITVGDSAGTEVKLTWKNLLSSTGENKKYNANFWAFVITDCTEPASSIDYDLPDNPSGDILTNWKTILSKKETGTQHHIIYKTNKTSSSDGNKADIYTKTIDIKSWIDNYYGGNYNQYYKECTYGKKKYGYVYLRFQEYHEWSSGSSGYFPHTDKVIAIKYNSGTVTAYDSDGEKHTAIVSAYDSNSVKHSTLITAFCADGDGHKVI